MLRPSLTVEESLWARGLVRIAGVDEAGVGPICGPVVAAAVVIRPSWPPLADVRDSKMLTASQRERLDAAIRREALAVGLGAASVREIEVLNVRRASHLAMWRALRRVGTYDHALVDGQPVRSVDLGPHTTIIDGDAKSYAIACASIVAKVARDRLMARLARRYPAYGWDQNRGYGTPRHLAVLRAKGPTPYHRPGFAPVREFLGEAGGLPDGLGEVQSGADAERET